LFWQINICANKKEIKACKKSVSIIVNYNDKNNINNKFININFNTIVNMFLNTNVKNKNKNNKIQLENESKNNEIKK